MVRRFTENTGNRKLLFGNDTDVSDCIITKYGNNILIVDIMIDEDSDKIYPTSKVLTLREFKNEFEMQRGTPMDYMSKEDYEWIIK